MNFLRIKWENIVTIITGAILTSMTVKYFIINGFEFNTMMFDIVFVYVALFITNRCMAYSRRMFLMNKDN